VSTPSRVEHPGSLAAGFLATLSIVGSALALVYRPVRLLPFAALLALIAVAMAPKDSRLPLIAVVFAAACFIAGLTIAVLTENPVF
jgi:hypothetical protein